jgi:hypothetical protein
VGAAAGLDIAGFRVRAWVKKFQRRFETQFSSHLELVNKKVTESELVKTSVTTYHALNREKEERFTFCHDMTSRFAK